MCEARHVEIKETSSSWRARTQVRPPLHRQHTHTHTHTHTHMPSPETVVDRCALMGLHGKAKPHCVCDYLLMDDTHTHRTHRTQGPDPYSQQIKHEIGRAHV